MEITRDIAGTRAAVTTARRNRRPIGFVPTMGYLHAAHLSLVEAARRDETFVVVSIFVNPTQFGPNEDLDRYPRDETGDLRKCESAGVDLVFIPPTSEMYPPGAATTVHVAGVTDTLCGPGRPGHFDGVATVVAKLFHIVQPDRAYFGEKDYQQLVVLRQMTRDLNLPIEVIGCPTLREPDGLAMSSRNAMLSPNERERALALNRSLKAARNRVRAGARDSEVIIEEVRQVLLEADLDKAEYISVVDPETLQPVARINAPVRIALAVRIGATRLIDNLSVDPDA